MIDAIETKCQFLFENITDCVTNDKGSAFGITFENNYMDKFPIIDSIYPEVHSNPSKIRIINSRYNCILPHENIIDKYDLSDIIEKYKRRINRFYDVLSNNMIRKIFIIVSHKDENIEELKKVLNKYTFNYIIRFKQYNKKTKFSSWKKTELDWDELLV